MECLATVVIGESRLFHCHDMGEIIYTLLQKNQLYQSENGTDWSKIESAPKLKMLVSNIYSQNNPEENNKLIAINTDNVFVESHNGTEWTEQESVPYGFPETSLSFVSYPLNTNSSIDRMLVLGENPIATDTTSVVWAQLSTENTWGNYPPEKRQFGLLSQIGKYSHDTL